MNISNVTNSTMPIRYCETIRETINNYPGEGLAQTILFDLLGGIIAAGFAYKFYQGIEVGLELRTSFLVSIFFHELNRSIQLKQGNFSTESIPL